MSTQVPTSLRNSRFTHPHTACRPCGPICLSSDDNNNNSTTTNDDCQIFGELHVVDNRQRAPHSSDQLAIHDSRPLACCSLSLPRALGAHGADLNIYSAYTGRASTGELLFRFPIALSLSAGDYSAPGPDGPVFVLSPVMAYSHVESAG